MSTQPSIFSRLREDEASADWQRFHDRYAPVVYHMALAHGLSEVDAQDTVQEVLLRFVRNVEKFRYDRQRGRFRNYLYTLTLNVVRTHLAKLAKSAHAVEGVDDVTLEHPRELWEKQWQANELRQAIDAVAAEVSPKTFQCFQLFVLEEWPAEKVGAFLGVTRETVYQAKSRVVKRLRVHLDRMNEE